MISLLLFCFIYHGFGTKFEPYFPSQIRWGIYLEDLATRGEVSQARKCFGNTNTTPDKVEKTVKCK